MGNISELSSKWITSETVRKMVSTPIFFFYCYYYFSRLSKQTRKQNFCNLLHTNKVFTEQEEKWISLNKVYKTLGVYKKPMAVNKWLSIHNFTQKKFILSFYSLFYFIYFYFILFFFFSFATDNKLNLER